MISHMLDLSLKLQLPISKTYRRFHLKEFQLLRVVLALAAQEIVLESEVLLLVSF